MKGYFSFLLVFFLVALIILLLQVHLDSNKNTQIKALQIKRMQSLVTNVKEVIRELARQGAIEGFEEYFLSIENPEKIRLDKLQEKIKTKIHEKLSLTADHTFSDDFEFFIWCGFDLYDRSDVFNQFLTEMKMQNTSHIDITNSYPLSAPECTDIVSFSAIDPKTEINSVYDLSSIKLGQKSSSRFNLVIGISVYSNKFNLSGIYFFPTDLNVVD